MPANKYALLRYRIIDRCLTNPGHPFPSKETLRLACEEALYGSDGERISISTIEKDLWAMRNETDLGYYAPIEYHRDERGYHYTEDGYSINDVQLNEDDLDAIRFATNTLIQFRDLPIFQQFDQALGKIADRLAVAPNLDTEGMEKYIQFESTPHAEGSEHLAPLLHAIRTKHSVQLSYKKFSDGTQVSTYNMDPYLLKEYRNRWYLLGWDRDKGHIRTLGCDRIQSLDPSEDLRFQMQPSFHATNHFEHALGITVLGDAKPEQVEFLCDPLLGKYLTSQPLHHSQHIEESSDEVRVTLNVMPTFELLQWLQAHANELTLLAPQSIKQSVVKTLEAALERQKRG
ncbi:MAG: hypothetical protein CL829_04825 [Crocinitomicaceae bacterium]|nr:hypothetical protein [Crocinitomicaceae bacterium]